MYLLIYLLRYLDQETTKSATSYLPVQPAGSPSRGLVVRASAS